MLTRKPLHVLALLVVLGVAAYWYWSPHLAIRSMKAAAAAGDANAFNQHVDYPKLRESLKGQFSARMAALIGGNDNGTDVQRAGGILGATLGAAIMDKMIDAFIRPELVMRAMAEAKLQQPMDSGRHTSKADNGPSKIVWKTERKGADRVLAIGSPSDAPESERASRVAFVFDREGFARWKLTEIRLPEAR